MSRSRDDRAAERCLTALAAAAGGARRRRRRRRQERFPSRTIRIIVPFPAGATTDMLARLFAQRHDRDPGTDRGGRECRRRRRLARRRPGRQGRARRPHAAVPQHHLHHHDLVAAVTPSARATTSSDFVPISVGAYVPLLLLAHPSVPANDLKEFVAYAKQTTDAAVLRLDRPRQHHASDGRGAQTRRRHQDGSRAVPRRRAAGDRAAVRPHPVRRRPAVELARARAHRRAQGAGGRHQVGRAAERADRARARLPESRAAGLERLPRAQGHAGARCSRGCSRRSRRPRSIPTCASA